MKTVEITYCFVFNSLFTLSFCFLTVIIISVIEIKEILNMSVKAG